jgi:hypothetical protein
MLEVRVKEVYSLAQLSDVSKTEIFAQAFGKAAEQKARAVGRAVADPVGTAKAIPGGLARFAKGIARTAKGTAVSDMAGFVGQIPPPMSAKHPCSCASGGGSNPVGEVIPLEDETMNVGSRLAGLGAGRRPSRRAARRPGLVPIELKARSPRAVEGPRAG